MHPQEFLAVECRARRRILSYLFQSNVDLCNTINRGQSVQHSPTILVGIDCGHRMAQRLVLNALNHATKLPSMGCNTRKCIAMSFQPIEGARPNFVLVSTFDR